MDASTVAQAALALAVDNSRDAALNELLQERERLALGAEDLRSFVAARHFTRNLLLQRGSVPPAHVPWTWERAYQQRHSDMESAYDVMLAALRDMRMGDPESAEQRLKHEVGESSAEEEEEKENVESN